MKKILQPGNKEAKDEIRCFWCAFCGCEFECSKDEYRYAGSQYNESMHKTDCPECGKNAYSKE